MLTLYLLVGFGVVLGYCCVAIVAYLWFLPTGQWYRRSHPISRVVAAVFGAFAFALASLCSLLRVPFGLLPYLVKVALTLGQGVRYEAVKTTYTREVSICWGTS